MFSVWSRSVQNAILAKCWNRPMLNLRRSGAESGSPIGRCAEIESSAAMLSSASTSRLQYLRPAKHPLVVKARYTAWITIPRRNWTNSSLPPTHSPTGRVLNLEKNNTRNPSTLLSFTRKTQQPWWAVQTNSAISTATRPIDRPCFAIWLHPFSNTSRSQQHGPRPRKPNGWRRN